MNFNFHIEFDSIFFSLLCRSLLLGSDSSVHGSAASLISGGSSLYGSTEDRQVNEVRRLKRELCDAREQVMSLSSQLSSNVSRTITLFFLFFFIINIKVQCSPREKNKEKIRLENWKCAHYKDYTCACDYVRTCQFKITNRWNDHKNTSHRHSAIYTWWVFFFVTCTCAYNQLLRQDGNKETTSSFNYICQLLFVDRCFLFNALFVRQSNANFSVGLMNSIWNVYSENHTHEGNW